MHKMTSFKLMKSLSVAFIIFMINSCTTQRVLSPYERAQKLYQDFKDLPFLPYGKFCASPTAMRSTYVEALLEIDPGDLTDPQVVDSISIYNRWQRFGGYRCDPSRFSCKLRQGSTQLWTCQCPEGEFGSQQLSVAARNETCEYKGGGSFAPSMVPTPCPQVTPAPTLPVPYNDEIICGIYTTEELKHSPANLGTLTIDSGLHYSNITCPAGLKCLMKEFDSECNVKNMENLTRWIADKNRKYANIVVDRRTTWPPCTCSDRTPLPFPENDSRQLEIDELLLTLPRAEWKKSCDRTVLSNIGSCLNSNWYLLQKPEFDLYKIIIEAIRAQGSAPLHLESSNPAKSHRFKRQLTIRSDCETTKGLVCDPTQLICLCRQVPRLPGFSPQFPNKVNSRGVCQLDSGSDCLFGHPFECADGENCLLAKLNVTCTEANYKAAEAKYWKEKQFEPYQRRCHCTDAKVEPKFEEIEKPIKSSGFSVWKSRGCFEIEVFVGISTIFSIVGGYFWDNDNYF